MGLRVRGVIDRSAKWVATKLALAELNRSAIKVGVLADDDAREGEPITNAELATIAEFGTKNIPRRPFLSAAADEHRAATIALMAQLAGDVTDGSLKPGPAFVILGEAQQAQARAKLRAGPWAPNAPATLARKSGSQPELDSEQLVNAISFKVVRK